MQRITTIILLLLVANLKAQPYHFSTFTTKDGLSSNNVAYVFKDSKGFLWCATPNGLNRFDGNAFDVYNNMPADSTTIASNNIQTIYEDSKAQLWIGTLGGISLYHATAQRFSNYAPDSSIARPGRVYGSMIEDAQHQLWLGTAYELLNFNPVTKHFTRSGWIDFINQQIPDKERRTRIMVLGFVKKSDAELWILTTYGLCSVVTATHQFTYYPFKEVDDYYGCQMYYYDTVRSAVWIGSYNNGLLQFNAATNQWKKHATPLQFLQKKDFDWAFCPKPMNGDTMMYCSQNGMMLFDKIKEQSLGLLPKSDSTITPFKGPYSNYFLQDGNIFWICTPNGLVQMQPRYKRFHFTNLSGNIPDDFVRNIHISTYNKWMFVGHDNPTRLYVFNESTGEKKRIFTNDGKPVIGHIDRVTEIAGGMAYLSTDTAMYVVQQQTLVATPIHLLLPDNIKAEVIYRNVVVDKTGIVWIRTRQHGIIRYNPKTKTSLPLAAVPAKDGRAFRMIFYNEKEHSLWISLEDEGLMIYDIATGKVRQELLLLAPSPLAATITSMVADTMGNVYLADFARGLYKYVVAQKKYMLYSHSDGMASDVVNDMAMDKLGNLWMATNDGICRYNTTTGIFNNYNDADGLPHILDNIRVGDDGNMYSRYYGGFYKWNIYDFDANLQQENIYLRNARCFGENMLIDTVYKMGYHYNTLLFQFGIRTQNASNSLLEYSVNNETFTNLDGANIIQFSKLGAGSYRLLVRQKNRPQNQFVVTIKIDSPYWMQWWFVTLMALLIGFLIVFFIKRRVGAVKKEAAYKQRIAATEMAALRAQMNPHFIFNCLSSIDNFIQDHNADKASDYLNKFAKLIRAILDNSKNETVPFWKDWQTLQLYLELEHLRSDYTFTYHLQADENLLNGHYKIPPLIIQPYVENAIHHGLKNKIGNDGTITITAQLNGDHLMYKIVDNGVGRAAAQVIRNSSHTSHTSYGMQISKERIEHFNTGVGPVKDIIIDDLLDEDGLPMGTAVTVLLIV